MVAQYSKIYPDRESYFGHFDRSKRFYIKAVAPISCWLTGTEKTGNLD
jgi:hypothetical protein